MKKTIVFFTLALAVGSCTVGCGSKSSEAAVQSVAAICGYSEEGAQERFAGVVQPRKQIEIKKTESLSIESVKVEVGDEVAAGQVLFSYDGSEASMNLEKAKLELEQLVNSVTSKKTQIQKLEKEQQQVSAAQKLTYTLEIQELEADIQEAEYNQTVKKAEIKKIETIMKNLDVTAPASGTVTSIKADSDDDSGSSTGSGAYMVITESGNYRILGYINENSAGKLYEGMRMLIHSRLDESVTWEGILERIDWDDPKTSSDNGDSMTSSSKYPFYVEPDSIDGLMLGQHVYLEQLSEEAMETEIAPGTVFLAAGFIEDIDGASWVWAENISGTLEKRTVTLGTYVEDLDAYIISDGLSLDDFIAFPSDNLKEGMTCTRYETSYADEFATED